MTVRQLVTVLAGLTLIFAGVSWVYPPAEVFHHLNGIAVSMGIMTIAAYSPVIRDAWRHAGTITAAHVLAFGIVTNWLGFSVRLGRWYVTASQPANDLAQWAYNIGMWISICAGVLLISALAMSAPKWGRDRIVAHIAAFFTIAMTLWLIDYSY